METSVHLTETCDDELPHLITQVSSLPAPSPDETMPTPIHEALEREDLLPAEHLMDAGYVTAEMLVSSQQCFGVQVIGPTRVAQQWRQHRFKGFTPEAFAIDWQQQRATYPQGHTSRSWKLERDHLQHEVVTIGFSVKDCRDCPLHQQCTTRPSRQVQVRSQPHYQALQALRQQQDSPEFRHRYAAQAGIEGTISQGVRAFGLRRSRYVGLAKTHAFHVGIAAAIDLFRLSAWLNGHTPAQTRRSAFVRLMQGTT